MLNHSAPAAARRPVSGSSIFMEAGIAVTGSPQSLIAATAGSAQVSAPLVDIGGIAADPTAC
jgi:hypothetical protein